MKWTGPIAIDTRPMCISIGLICNTGVSTGASLNWGTDSVKNAKKDARNQTSDINTNGFFLKFNPFIEADCSNPLISFHW